jgi:hypothetical protein
MAGNAQNTYPGTANGGNVIYTVGNGFIDALAAIGNVGVNTLDTAGSLLDRFSSFKEKYQNLANANQSNPPQQSMPENLLANWGDFLSDPERVQKMFLYAGLAALVATGTIYIIKKM